MLDEGLGLGRLGQRILGIVVSAHAPLLGHHRQLGVEPFGIEIGHAISFEADRHIEVIAIDHFEVVGEVGAGERVIHPAVLLDDVGELLGAVFFGAAEHQMLDQMRDAGLAEALVARSDLAEHVEGGDRRLMIFQHQDLEPVGQGLGLDLVGDACARGAASAKKQQRSDRARQSAPARPIAKPAICRG